MRNLLLCVLILLSGYCHLVSSVPSCDKPEESCMCYSELEQSLLATERNVIQLSTTFFPLESNQPEFVTVKYTFDNSNVTQLMFWSVQTSHFLHPFEVFQFMSLFFSKPEPYYTGELTVQLYNNCSKLSSTDENLQILTQRLKYYAERRSPILRDSYSAKVYTKESLKVLINEDHKRITNIIICTSVFVVVFSFVIVALVLFTFFYTESHAMSKWGSKVKKNWPLVAALSVVSFIANVYIIFLSGTALGFWRHRGDTELRKLLYNPDKMRNIVPLVFALLVDVLGLISFIVIVFVATSQLCIHINRDKLYPKTNNCRGTCKLSKCHCKDCLSSKCNDNNQCTSRWDLCRYKCVRTLSLTVLCPIFCVIAHSPYIAISYLNDGSHASSIFIYYAILGYSLFGLLYLFFHWFENVTPILMRKCEAITTIVILILVIFIFFGLIVVISCYFVLIPINKAISDAPNRVLSIYESGGFVIGSIFIYELLSHFHKKTKKDDDLKKIKKNVKKICKLLVPTKVAKSTIGKSKSAPNLLRKEASVVQSDKNYRRASIA